MLQISVVRFFDTEKEGHFHRTRLILEKVNVPRPDVLKIDTIVTAIHAGQLDTLTSVPVQLNSSELWRDARVSSTAIIDE